MAVKASVPEENGVRVLLVSPAEADHIWLRHILDHSRWKLYRAPNCREALALLRKHSIGVVIAAAELPDGNWRSLLEAVMRLPGSPSLIVASRLADERLWAEVLNVGGYDLLLTPFEPGEVFRVGSAAWRFWERRLQSAPLAGNPGHGWLRPELPAA